MKYLVILILIFVYNLFGNELGYTNSSHIYTHVTYIFQHASILHLVFNSLAFIGMYASLEKFVNRWLFLSLSLFCAILTSFGAMYDKPTVGISGVIYVMIGLYVGITLLYKKAKIADTRRYLLFIFGIVFCLVVSRFHASSNFLLHSYCLLCGLIVSFPLSIWKNRKLKIISFPSDRIDSLR